MFQGRLKEVKHWGKRLLLFNLRVWTNKLVGRWGEGTIHWLEVSDCTGDVGWLRGSLSWLVDVGGGCTCRRNTVRLGVLSVTLGEDVSVWRISVGLRFWGVIRWWCVHLWEEWDQSVVCGGRDPVVSPMDYVYKKLI